MSGTSVFQRIFRCCLARPKERKAVVDETTHLIPAIEDPDPEIPHEDFVDQQRIRDRLNTIVRSKENKMVNVNSALPFNLHNRVIPSQDSSSRSASTSTNRYSYGGAYGSGDHPRRHSHLSAANVTPSPPRTPSQSRDRRSISPTPESSDSDPGGANLHVYTRSPVLGVRLVQQNGEYLPPAETIRGRRGRTGPNDKGKEPVTGPSSEDSQRAEALRLTADYLDAGVSDTDPDMTPRPPGLIRTSPTSPTTAAPSSPQPISPPVGFKIEDTDITMSWED